MPICWKRAALLAFRLGCFVFHYVILILCVHFGFGSWNSIASVPNHWLFIYFGLIKQFNSLIDKRNFYSMSFMIDLRVNDRPKSMFSITPSLKGCVKLSVTSIIPFEPRHDKTNKMAVRPANTQISLGIRPV